MAMSNERLNLMKPLLPILLGTGLLLASVVHAGYFTRARLDGSERFVGNFADIVCEPPPGIDREEFLSEVRYISGFPGKFGLLDSDIAPRLGTAFSKHPWVETVQRVELQAAGPVTVQIQHRRPVLQVVHLGVVRAVDRHAVLLPPSAATKGLPTHETTPAKPPGPVGTQWDDRGVIAAARSAAARK
jgi:hypothetical protein